jgi:BirA family biotin operon repressor/biotin-[acetyl-CoA-carboxylase] ligase
VTFNIQEFRERLYRLEIADPLQFHWYGEVGSTNDQAWKLLKQGIKSDVVVVIAERQTAGRGQRGRQWESQVGGLYCSVGLTSNLDATQGVHLTLLSAWGIANALRRYEIPVQLKWLNDLLLQRGKLGGIKTETHIQQDKITQAVVGVGINWRNHPPSPGINLQDYPAITSIEKLAAVTVAGILQGYQRYQQLGIEGILPGYLSLLSNLGKTINIEGNTGVIVGVTEKGELKVRLSSPNATTDIKLPPGSIQLRYDFVNG